MEFSKDDIPSLISICLEFISNNFYFLKFKLKKNIYLLNEDVKNLLFQFQLKR